MKLKKISLLFFLTFFFVSYLSSNSDCLKNIGKKFIVVVEGLSGDARKIRLTRERLKTVTELKLRKEGMDIRELSDILDTPVVYVNVNVLREAFNISLCIMERVEIQRISFSKFCNATTWSRGTTGMHGNDPEFIVSALSGLLDEFLNDYYKANPKKEVNHGNL